VKKLVTNYTFDASTKTITFDDYSAVELSKILLITNVTDGIIIYNFASAAKGGTVATNVLTLDHDTTSMDDADKLQIFYDDGERNLLYRERLTSGDTLTPTAGKRLKIEKIQVLQHPDNSVANSVTIDMPSQIHTENSSGNIFDGWTGSDTTEIIGDVDEEATITLGNSNPVSVMINYKEL
jgi:hypothetical protein